MKINFFILLFLFVSCSDLHRLGPDKYGDFYSFALRNFEGKDYEIKVKDISSKCSAFAIHAGLERGSDTVAEKIAQENMNLYVFKAISKKTLKESHITSSRFNEPRAVFLAKKSDYVFSFHGMAEKGEKVCIGGKAKSLAKEVYQQLTLSGFSSEYPCKRLPGTSPKNIANLAKNGGVQFEISLKLLKKLDKNPNKLLKFSEAVNKAAHSYCLKVGH